MESMAIIKHRLLEAVIEMHGGVEPLKEILLNEIGDTQEGRSMMMYHLAPKAFTKARRYDRRGNNAKADKHYQTVQKLLNRVFGSKPKGTEDNNDLFDRLSRHLPHYYRRRTVEAQDERSYPKLNQ